MDLTGFENEASCLGYFTIINYFGRNQLVKKRSTLCKNSSVPSIHNDASDLG